MPIAITRPIAGWACNCGRELRRRIDVERDAEQLALRVKIAAVCERCGDRAAAAVSARVLIVAGQDRMVATIERELQSSLAAARRADRAMVVAPL